MDALFAQQKETIRDLLKELKQKDREIEKLTEDLRLYAISVCPDKDRELDKKDREIAELKERIDKLELEQQEEGERQGIGTGDPDD
jgi:predicted RNase H-like nuclease (RuvC/YqgF family)